MDKFLIQRTYRLAQQGSPIDTGFLRHHGIRLSTNNYGWTITWDVNKVPYIKYMELGTATHGKHQNFVSSSMSMIEKEVIQHLNGRQKTERRKHLDVANNSLEYERRQHQIDRRRMLKMRHLGK